MSDYNNFHTNVRQFTEATPPPATGEAETVEAPVKALPTADYNSNGVDMTYAAEGADPLSERIDGILTPTAESICGEWDDGMCTGADAVMRHMPYERDEILALIREERRAELEWLKDQQSFFAGAGEVVTVADIEARINQLNNEVNPNDKD